MGTPDDIFRAAFFLVNDSTYITGQNIIVDGGYLMR
ncbi:MAG TPA: SDR family oxidoreductase [Spirochaetota bacterium]